MEKVCHIACGRVFDIGYVTIVARYADCSVFRCPGCNGLIDDRPGIHIKKVAAGKVTRKI